MLALKFGKQILTTLLMSVTSTLLMKFSIQETSTHTGCTAVICSNETNQVNKFVLGGRGWSCSSKTN
jgi:hypothetical protein